MRAEGCIPARLLRGALFVLFVLGSFVAAQMTQKLASKNVSAHRANQLTLGGLRPGRDTAALAIRLYKKPSTSDSRNHQMTAAATCQTQRLFLDLDADKTIRVIRAIETPRSPESAGVYPLGLGKTGRGRGVGDAAGG